MTEATEEAEDYAAAREAISTARQPGRHSTKGWSPYVSGFCKPERPPWSHALCPGEIGPNKARCNGVIHVWPEEGVIV